MISNSHSKICKIHKSQILPYLLSVSADMEKFLSPVIYQYQPNIGFIGNYKYPPIWKK